jgi:triacylglycerol esterase/lipase EstA (alpha/beta hydrolase family)
MASHTFILDGIWGRPRRWEPLRRAIESRVGPAEIYHYDASGMRRFETLAAKLIDRIRTIDQPVNLIGFSMGGLVCRTACLLAPDLPVRRAAFLNTPHGGSILAFAAPLAGIRQLCPGSDLLCKLAKQPWTVPTLVVWNPLDTAVLPPRHTRWKANPSASEAVCGVPLHIWPIFSSRLRERIVAFMANESPDSRVSA